VFIIYISVYYIGYHIRSLFLGFYIYKKIILISLTVIRLSGPSLDSRTNSQSKLSLAAIRSFRASLDSRTDSQSELNPVLVISRYGKY